MTDYDKTIARLVGVAYQSYLRRLDKHLKRQHLPLTSEQYKFMSLLWREDGISQQHIAEALGRDRSAVTRMVELLERKQLIARRPHEEDGRIKEVYLTAAGRALEQRADTCAQATLQESLSGMSHEELLLLRRGMQQMIHNLNA